ncbi:FAD-dependent oxidoreductase [Luteibacter sp.]|uniref:FAD-dependent oxidoreductase n=1 Tax=Luteibacter sp. TaxID=1886636 RepID=UPI00280775EF|nr:FAD-dependent oxidoreductase [Luteibacter sp.]MDQ8050845.1 FAD-dependent oxidoreductase [Luteibacter sp.]
MREPSSFRPRSIFRTAAAAVLLLGLATACRQPPSDRAEVVVYGGTAGGVIAAVSAAREGRKVIVLEPGERLGGMISGGLSANDVGTEAVIGGFSREFFERAGKYYGVPIQWNVEPHVAEKILEDMAHEAGVTVLYGQRLRETNGVSKHGTHIDALTMENGRSFRAKIFLDATYEGDLMAQANVSYTWGRESSARYGESLAGVRVRTPKHQFELKVSAFDRQGKLLPEIQPGPRGAPGSGDRKVQAYNFRLCMTQVRSNLVTVPRPASYVSARYALLARTMSAMESKLRRPLTVGEVLSVVPIPNGKADINNNGAFSTDFIGGNWDYPQADYAARAEIWQAHRDYEQGLIYFLMTDGQVSNALRKEMQSWGLCRDEFVQTGHWPHQLYIREARRMLGEFVMTQRDIQDELTKPDSVGMGSYNSDSHNVQRFVDERGFVQNEGDMQVEVQPYQIPYGILLPKRNEASNLLVPVAFSASHVAYSTLRMEPQYMILGQAAGVAAHLAIRGGTSVQDLDRATLSAILRKQRAVLELHTAAPTQSLAGAGSPG